MLFYHNSQWLYITFIYTFCNSSKDRGIYWCAKSELFDFLSIFIRTPVFTIRLLIAFNIFFSAWLKYDDIIKARRSIVLNFYNKLEDIIAEDYKKGILIEDDRSNTDTLYKPIITRQDVFDYGLDMGFNIQFVPIISVNASAIADYEATNQQQITNTDTNERKN